MADREYKLVSVDQIELDLENSRIAKWVEVYGNGIAAQQIFFAPLADRYGGSYA